VVGRLGFAIGVARKVPVVGDGRILARRSASGQQLGTILPLTPMREDAYW